MGRALFLALVAVGVLAGCAPRQPRSVVLIVIDTLRQDRLATYGYGRNTSPTLDLWGARGAVADGLSPTSWTKPAVASILTGLHPLRHHSSQRIDVLPPQVTTLAEVFEADGYQTLGISANGWISRAWGFDQGFDELVVLSELGFGVASADELNQVLRPRLRNLHHPFFLYVHYVDPHTPYDPPIGWDGAPLSAALASRVPMTDQDLNPQTFAPRDEGFVRDASDLYDGEIRFVDGQIGVLLDELEQLGLMSSTVTAITADHGEEFQDHGRMGHGQALYVEQTAVPLIIHAPGQVAPGTRLGTVSLLDLFPTLVDLAGQHRFWGVVPYHLDGESQADVLAGRRAAAHSREFLLHLDTEAGQSLALVRSSRKIVLGRRPFTKALYDLSTDPREQRDLLSDRTRSEFADLADDLAERYNSLRGRAFDQLLAGNLKPEDAAALRALGYITADEQLQKPDDALPSRVVPADPHPDGLLGWEPRPLPTCVQTGRSAYRRQLARGWYPEEQPPGVPPGRWTGPDASVALGWPRGRDCQLVLKGFNFRPATFRLTVEVEGSRIIDTDLASGRFELRSSVDRATIDADYAIIRVHSDPPFHPTSAGLADRRILGVFLTSLCFEHATG